MNDRHEFSSETQSHPHVMAALGMASEKTARLRGKINDANFLTGTAPRWAFTHGRFQIESVYSEADSSRFNIFRDNGDFFFVVLSGEGAELGVHGEGETLTFGGTSDFDELRDLITFLRGKVAEKAK